MNKVASLKIEAREYVDEYIEDGKEADASNHFLRIRQNQLIDLMQHLERYTNTLPVFGLNSGRFDINLIKSYLISFLINEKETEPIIIKNANLFASFKLGDVRLLDFLQCLDRAISFHSFLKAYEVSEKKGYFP